MKKPLPKGGPDVLTIKETAEILDVRRWGRSGKFALHWHPVHGYRGYRWADVPKLRKKIETGKVA